MKLLTHRLDGVSIDVSYNSEKQKIKKNRYSNKTIGARTHIAESKLARRKRTHGSIPSNQRTLASG